VVREHEVRAAEVAVDPPPATDARPSRSASPGLQGDPFDPSSFTFWRREPDLYLRGVSDLLPVGVRMQNLIHRRDVAEDRA
jgi:hypothetical protein